MLERSRKGAGASRGRRARWAVLVGLLALSSPVAAQPKEPDQATLEQARTLGRAGLALYEKGDCGGALAKFREAYALYKAPTIGLMSARCEARLGRLAAAEALYREVMDMPLGDAPTPAFDQARQDAIREHQALLPRVPRLTIVVELPSNAAPLPQATVLLDGAPVGSASLGAPQLVEVGTHEISAERGDAKVTERVEVREGDQRRVVLRLDPADPTKSKIRNEQVDPSPDSSGQGQRILGWTAVGLGGAGVVVGSVLGGLAIGKRGDLDEQGCQEGVCPDSLQGDVDSYNTMRMVSGVGLIAGAALAVGGVVLVLSAPAPEAGATQGSRPRLSARAGLGSIGVEGTF